MDKSETLKYLKEVYAVISEARATEAQIVRIDEGIKAAEEKQERISCAPFRNFLIIFGLLGLLIGSVVGLLIGLVVGLIVAVIACREGSRLNKKLVKKMDQIELECINPLKVSREPLYKKMCELYECNLLIQLDDVVPSNYQEPNVIKYFIEMLETERVSNMGAAINLYEQEQHNRRMEAMQQAQLATAQQTLTTQRDQKKINEEILKKQQEQAAYAKKTSKQVRYGNVVSTVDAVRHWNDKKK